MRTYETVFILKPTLSADDQIKHLDFYKDNIRKSGGEIIKEESWGKQQLAYQVQTFNDGIYILIQFKADNKYINEELEKRFQYNEDVIRYVVVMLDEKKFKINPRKDPVRRDRPATDRPAARDVEEITVEAEESTVTAEKDTAAAPEESEQL